MKYIARLNEQHLDQYKHPEFLESIDTPSLKATLIDLIQLVTEVTHAN